MPALDLRFALGLVFAALGSGGLQFVNEVVKGSPLLSFLPQKHKHKQTKTQTNKQGWDLMQWGAYSSEIRSTC